MRIVPGWAALQHPCSGLLVAAAKLLARLRALLARGAVRWVKLQRAAEDADRFVPSPKLHQRLATIVPEPPVARRALGGADTAHQRVLVALPRAERQPLPVPRPAALRAEGNG